MSAEQSCDPEVPPPSRPEGGPLREMVGLWKYHLALHYTSLEHISESLVTSIRWYKYSEGFEHEYLVATVQRKDPRGVCYLRIERRASRRETISKDNAMDPNITQKYDKNQMKGYEASIKKETAALGRILGGFQSSRDTIKGSPPLADDTVIQVLSDQGELGESELEPIKLVATYDRFQNPLSLRDLGFIANAVNGKAKAYHFFVNQCYWFARTMVEVIKYRHHPEESAGEFFGRAGSFKDERVKINGDDPHAVAHIAEGVEVALKEHDDEVDGRYQEATRAKRVEEQLKAANERERQLEQELRDTKAKMAALTASIAQR